MRWKSGIFTPQLSILFGVALLLRMISFGNPIVHVDEEFYLVIASAWIDGALPFVDLWDRKPIGLFALYLPAAALQYPASIWAYQGLALFAAVATAALITLLAIQAGWRRGALAGGVAYLAWLNLLEGQGGQAPVFYNLPMAGAALLLLPDGTEARVRFARGLIAMVLVGLAIQIKYSAVFEGLFFGLWAMWRERSQPARATLLAIPWAGAALLPTAAVWAAYSLNGHGEAFVFANFESIFARVPDPAAEQLENLGTIVLITAPLIAAASLSPYPNPQTRWLFAWLVVAGTALLLFGSWFDHYALPLIVPASICASGFFGDHRAGQRLALPLLAIVLVAGIATVQIKRAARGSPEQFARVAEAVGRGSGCLWVYSRDTMLYLATNRCRATRYIFPSHLGRFRESGAIGVDQKKEISRILAAGPDVITMRDPYRGEDPQIRRMVLTKITRRYRMTAELPLGNETVRIFRRL